MSSLILSSFYASPYPVLCYPIMHTKEDFSINNKAGAIFQITENWYYDLWHFFGSQVSTTLAKIEDRI